MELMERLSELSEFTFISNIKFLKLNWKVWVSTLLRTDLHQSISKLERWYVGAFWDIYCPPISYVSAIHLFFMQPWCLLQAESVIGDDAENEDDESADEDELEINDDGYAILPARGDRSLVDCKAVIRNYVKINYSKCNKLAHPCHSQHFKGPSVATDMHVFDGGIYLEIQTSFLRSGTCPQVCIFEIHPISIWRRLLHCGMYGWKGRTMGWWA